MGLKTDIYVRSRDGMNFLFECQTNPIMKGYQSRIADKAYADAWRRMKDGELPLDFEKLSDKPLDEMNDREIVWFLDQIDRGSKRISNNLNARRRYLRFKQSTNL